MPPKLWNEWLVTWRVHPLRISSDAQALVNQDPNPFEASIGDMLSGNKLGLPCRATIATPKPLVKIDFHVSCGRCADADAFATKKGKNHITPLVPFLHPHSISMTLPLVADLVGSPHPLRLRSPFRELASSRSIFFLPCLATLWWLGRKQVFELFNNFSLLVLESWMNSLLCCLRVFSYFRRAVSSGRRRHDSAPVGSDYQTQGHFMD
jgi:hypothetical protein